MKTEKRKSLQGSVLFTVVCVMALLIIFLTGTLALASASSNRAHKSYSSSQANYTARATIESFVQAMELEPGIPAAIENLKDDPLYATVVINDKTLGQIGCYKDNVWTPDVIEIAPVPATKDQYVYADLKGDKDWKWVKVTSVKITAVCRVGKEEETVTAYLQKSPGGSTKTTPGGIRGLQEVGGNAFPNGGHITGGLGVGIACDSSGMYTVHNNTNVETTLTFVNGSLTSGTGSSNFYVRKPAGDKASTPYSQTVITGNLWLNNSNFMIVDYNMAGDYTEKEIPYLYIDGTVGGKNPTIDLISGDGVGPFNIFIGTLDGRQDKTKDGTVTHAYNFGNADLYLMDKPSTDENGDPETITLKYPGTNGDDEERNFSAEAMSEGDDPRTDAEKACDKVIEKGQNYLGTSMGTNTLYSWTSSCVNKTEQFTSHGGNIFCNGNLTIENFTIAGDLRVAENCTIGNNVNVGGKIVVGKHLQINDANFKNWNKVYCGSLDAVGATNADIPVLQDGYTEHINELYPNYKEVHNLVYDNEPVSEELYEIRESFQDPDDGWRWHIRYPEDDDKGRRISDENDGWGPNGANFAGYQLYVITDPSATVEGPKVGDTVPRYRTDGAGFPTDTITFNSTVTYLADPATEAAYMDETGNYKIVDNEYSYYLKDEEGNAIFEQEVSRDTAYGTYYLYGDDPTPRPESEAYKTENVTYHNVNEFGEVYPQCMTREAIYGSGESLDDFSVDPKTKIIKNLVEMRNDLKLDPFGDYDPNVYFTSVPENFWDDSITEEEGAREGVYKLPYAFNSDGTKNTSSGVWEGDYIVKSCVIGNKNGSNFDIPTEVKIKATNITWVVLRNVTFNQNDGKNMQINEDMDGKRIVCNTDNGTVRFLLDGYLIANKGAIIKEGFKNKDEINPSTTWNIEYYGCMYDSNYHTYQGEDFDPEQDTPFGSAIYCGNNVTLCGTFMCPETKYSGNVSGAYKVYYTDEYGNRQLLDCPIIGSALFNKVEKAKNSFGVLNSGGGGVDTNKETVQTEFGMYNISYFMGV